MSDAGEYVEHLRRVFERRHAEKREQAPQTGWEAYLAKFEAEFSPPMRRKRSFLNFLISLAPRS